MSYSVRSGFIASAAIIGIIIGGCGDDAPVGGDSTPTTCVEAPATTAPGMPGGGELICGPVDSGDGNEAPDTTVPAP